MFSLPFPIPLVTAIVVGVTLTICEPFRKFFGRRSEEADQNLIRSRTIGSPSLSESPSIQTNVTSDSYSSTNPSSHPERTKRQISCAVYKSFFSCHEKVRIKSQFMSTVSVRLDARFVCLGQKTKNGIYSMCPKPKLRAVQAMTNVCTFSTKVSYVFFDPLLAPRTRKFGKVPFVVRHNTTEPQKQLNESKEINNVNSRGKIEGTSNNIEARSEKEETETLNAGENGSKQNQTRQIELKPIFSSSSQSCSQRHTLQLDDKENIYVGKKTELEDLPPIDSSSSSLSSSPKCTTDKKHRSSEYNSTGHVMSKRTDDFFSVHASSPVSSLYQQSIPGTVQHPNYFNQPAAGQKYRRAKAKKYRSKAAPPKKADNGSRNQIERRNSIENLMEGCRKSENCAAIFSGYLRTAGNIDDSSNDSGRNLVSYADI